MFWTRVASGVVLAPLFLALVYWEKPFFHVMVAAIAGIMAYEFLRMDGKAGPKRQALTIGGIVVAVLAMTFHSATAGLLIGAAAGLGAILSDNMAGRKERHVAQKLDQSVRRRHGRSFTGEEAKRSVGTSIGS